MGYLPLFHFLFRRLCWVKCPSVDGVFRLDTCLVGKIRCKSIGVLLAVKVFASFLFVGYYELLKSGIFIANMCSAGRLIVFEE